MAHPDTIYRALGAQWVAPIERFHVHARSLEQADLPSLWLALSLDIAGNASIPATTSGASLLLEASPGLLVTTGAQELGPEAGHLTHAHAACPTLVLAGRSGAGKSSIAAEIERTCRVVRDDVVTTRRPRPKELDGNLSFEDGGDPAGQSRRRSPRWAIPVRSRGADYWYPLADALILRFSGNYDLHVVIDSHPLRLHWYRRVVPDCRIFWLHCDEDVRRERSRDRADALTLDAAEHGRELADWAIDTTGCSAFEIARHLMTRVLR